MAARIDHLVVVAASLEEGEAWCRATLGVAPGPGGAHARMGTHNRLLRLGEDVYLEIIAIDSAAPAPERARWFGMDDPLQQQRIADSGPFLTTWMAQTDAIEVHAPALPAIGPVHPMSRGELQWRLTISEDGGLVEHGCVPGLIEWPAGVHPTRNMPALGFELQRLTAYHPEPQRLAAMWQALGLDDARLAVAQGSPGLAAELLTPQGPLVLLSA